MENLTGQTIKTYELHERIGAGGFGAVYRAIQSVINREVAVKVILPEHANHPDFVSRFETEAQLVARLEHPHIVPLYDYWREPTGAFLVMRFLRGGSLREALEQNGPWPTERVASLLLQIGAALTFAHQNGVIHRDLKSDNILLDDLGNAYLTDFGIAKDLGTNLNLTKDAILGTPAYLAPEQIRGEAASPQSDIYALGIMTYEILAGSKPFFDMTPATLLFKQLNEPLPDITIIRQDLPPAVNEVLQQATAKKVELRFNDTFTFARAFQQALSGSMDFITGQTTTAIPLTTTEMELLDLKNPYKGLRAFQQADSSDFFGRERLVQRLLERMRENHEYRDFLAVVGPSGSGKSSVVKAGLLPRIRQGMLDESQTWYVAEMVPGTHPMEELEACLLSVAVREAPGMLEQLREDERGLIRIVKRILPDNGQLVLFIDQFEETFTLVNNENARRHFLDTLLEAAGDLRSRIKIILTMRADFYDRPLLYGSFGELIRQRTELVLPLNDEELEEAIAGPARRIGVSLEMGLVNAIISDVNQQPGALPLLQYALTELFERRIGRSLTTQAYEAIGGTTGALARRAEELFNDFDDTHKEAARQLFLRLVTLGEGTEDTRRRVLQSELLSISEQSELMMHVIDIFGKYRLLTFDRDPATRGSTVEVAHEALIRQWERMRAWLDENREGLRLQRRLTLAADEWEYSGHDPSFLARGVRLQQLEDWAAQSNIALNEMEASYLRHSIEAREKLLEAERERAERERRLEAQSRNRLRALAWVMGVAALIGGVLATIAILQSLAASEARAQAEEALIVAEEAREEAQVNAAEASSLALAANARNALTEGDPQLALALAFEAEQVYSPASAEVVRVLSSSAYAPGPRWHFADHSASIYTTAYSNDSRLMASAGWGGTIIIHDVRAGEIFQQISLPDLFITHVFFALDDATLYATLSDGTIRYFDVESGDEVRQWQAHEDVITGAALSPDGTLLMTASTDRSAIAWDTATGEEVQRFAGHVGVVVAAAFSPDGMRLLTGTTDETMADTTTDEVDRRLRVYDVATGISLLTLAPGSGFVRTVAFSPDGQLFATGLWDAGLSGTARVYNSSTGVEIRRFFAHTTPISRVIFSADSATLITASWDQSIRLWDIQRGIETAHFVGFPDRILSLSLSPDGDYLAIGMGNVGDNELQLERERSRDTSLWHWDLRARDAINTLDGHTEWLWAVALSPDGQRAATGSGPLRTPADPEAIDITIRLWDLTTGEELTRLRAHTNTIDSLVFLPDGERLLSAGWDGQIILWDLAEETILRAYEGHEGTVYKLAVSGDGTQFASAGGDSTVRLWDTESGEQIRQYVGHERAVNGVAFSPDETQLATSSSDRTIRLWDVETGEEIRQFTGHTDSVNEVLFSPNGQWLVSSSWDDTIRLWNLETATEIRQFTGHNGNTFGLAFNQDSSILLTTSQDRTVRLWDVTSGEELHRYLGHTDWVQEVVLSPDETFALSVAQDTTLRIWRVARTTDALRAFAEETRSLRVLSCAERQRYRLEACPVEDTGS